MIIYSYAGFGDHCACYGMIKEWSKQYDKIFYRSDAMSINTFNTCKRLYSSLSNVELIFEPIKIADDRVSEEVDWAIANTSQWFDKTSPWLNNPKLPLTEELQKNKEYWHADYQWYMNANIPFHLMWDNFYVKRDLNKEKEIYYDTLGLKDNEEYIFVNENPLLFYGETPFVLNKNYITPDIRLIELFKIPEVNILDLTYTIEHSLEVHTYNSGPAVFIDLMKMNVKKLFYHHYVRPLIFWRPTLKLNWIILDE